MRRYIISYIYKKKQESKLQNQEIEIPEKELAISVRLMTAKKSDVYITKICLIE